MHRKTCVPRHVLWTTLLGVLLCGAVGAGPAAAQEGPPPPTLVVPINGTKPLQMSNKQLIVTVQNQNPEVARVSPVANDPTSVLVTGLMAGTTRVTLTDKEKRSEAFDIVVQLDVAFLRKVLQDTVPSANVIPIPVGSGAIILSGTVAKTEDVPIVLEVARSILGNIQLTNALRLGGVQQVQLCVSVAKVSRSQLRNMAFEFLRTGPNNVFSSTLGSPLNFASALGPITAAAGSSSVIGNPGNLFYGIMTPNHGFFGWLTALRSEGLTKILANPEVVAISGRPASFLDGGEQAIPVPAGLGQIGVQFEEFGTRLNVLPIVLGNGKIHLEVEPEVSDLDAAFGTAISGTIVPGRSTQRVHTTVELEAGQTFAIGGLIQHKITANATKVPIAGDLPFIGAAFRAVTYNEEEEELLILVTPYLVDALACNQLPKFLPGEETRSPDDFELFLEGILEAPRGPRETCSHGCYTPAWKNGPTASQYPCGYYGFGTHGVCDCGPTMGSTCATGGACHRPVIEGHGQCGANGGCGGNGCGQPAANGAAPVPGAPMPGAPVPGAVPGAPAAMPPAAEATPAGGVTPAAGVQEASSGQPATLPPTTPPAGDGSAPLAVPDYGPPPTAGQR